MFYYNELKNFAEYDYVYDEIIPCATLARDGYSCVPSNQCDNLLDVRGFTEPVCEDPSQKCCHVSKQIQENEMENKDKIKPCSAFKNEGYQCVPRDNCRGLADIRTGKVILWFKILPLDSTHLKFCWICVFSNHKGCLYNGW